MKLALFGFVFLGPEGGFIFIILCGKYVYVHFWPLKKLGLFFRTAKSSDFLYSFVIQELAFIWAFLKLGLIGFELGLFFLPRQRDKIFIIHCY